MLNNSRLKLSDLTGGAPVVAMLGMCKNAGKTTALNRLIGEYGASGRKLAITSIGRDGESLDLVTGTPKPPIFILEGMLAATASELLRFSDVSREILDVTDTMTPLGMVVVFRARSGGYVQLAGPSAVEDMSRLCKRLHDFGAETVLIDGALNRRSPAAGAHDGVCVLSTGASLGRDIDEVVSETAFVCQILTLPEDNGRWTMDNGQSRDEDHDKFTVFGDDKAETTDSVEELCRILKRSGAVSVAVSGALTDTAAREAARSGAKTDGIRFIVEDSSRILIKKKTFDMLTARGVIFRVRRGTRLAAVTINPVSAGGRRFDADEFLEKMRNAVTVPVVDTERL